MHHAFLYISLPSTARLPVKVPNFTFGEGRKQAMTKFFLFIVWLIEIPAPEELACIWQSKRVGIITIKTEKNMNLLFYVTFSWLSAVVVSFKNSLQIHLRKDVADPRVNTCCKLKVVFGKASLVFGQTVVWNQMGVYIKLKVSWLPAFLWCMSQTSRDLDNSRRVLTHEKNSGETVRRLGTIIKGIFCAQSGASIHLNFWK